MMSARAADRGIGSLARRRASAGRIAPVALRQGDVYGRAALELAACRIAAAARRQGDVHRRAALELAACRIADPAVRHLEVRA